MHNLHVNLSFTKGHAPRPLLHPSLPSAEFVLFFMRCCRCLASELCENLCDKCWLVRKLYEILSDYHWLVRKLCEILCDYCWLVRKLLEILCDYHWLVRELCEILCDRDYSRITTRVPTWPLVAPSWPPLAPRGPSWLLMVLRCSTCDQTNIHSLY